MFIKKKLQEAIEDHNIDGQLEIFERLAERYLAQSRWEDNIDRLGYIRSSGIYNYCINLCKSEFARDIDGNIKKEYEDKKKLYKKKLQEIEEKFLQDIEVTVSQKIKLGSADNGLLDNIHIKFAYNDPHKELINIRNNSRIRLNEIKKARNKENDIWDQGSENQVLAAKEIIDIYNGIIKEIKHLVQKLVVEGVAILGVLPREYAIIGFGSISRGEMTPYSDLDWGIVIEEGDKGKEEAKEYFRKLSYLICLKLVNLGETVLPSLAIKELNDFTSNNQDEDNWFYDKVTPKGLSFDALLPKASKWPLGNTHLEGITPENKYELIGTAYELRAYIGMYKANTHLGSVLSNAVFITGNQSLADKYIGAIELSLNEQDRKELGVLLITNDTKTYSPFEIGKSQIVFDAKKAIYRFVESILEGISNYYGIAVGTTWEKIGLLKESKVICEEAQRNLKVALGIAMEVRLSTYLEYERQTEDIGAFKNFGSNLEKHIPSLYKVSNDQLTRYYYTTLPFYNQILKFLNNKENKLLDRHDSLYNADIITRGMIKYLFMQYEEAHRLLSQVSIAEIEVVAKANIISELMSDKEVKEIVLYHQEPKIIGREKEREEACLELWKHSSKIITLSGVSGVGKSELAEAIKFELMSKSGYVVHTFIVERKGMLESMNLQLRTYIDKYFITHESSENLEVILRRFAAGLRNKPGNYLFIWDNVEDFSNIIGYIDILRSGYKDFKFIITSQYQPSSEIFNSTGYLPIELRGFNIAETQVFLDNKGLKRNISEEDLRRIFQEYNDFEVLPRTLVDFVSYSNDNENCNMDCLKHIHKSGGFSMKTLSILPNVDSKTWLFLQSLAYLNHKSVPKNLFDNVYSYGELERILTVLLKNRLIDILEDDSGNIVFRMHDKIHNEILQIIERSPDKKAASYEKKQIFEKLAGLLNHDDKIPYYDIHQPEQKISEFRKRADTFIVSAVSFLENDFINDMAVNKDISELFIRVASYKTIVGSEFKQGISYYRKALAMLENDTQEKDAKFYHELTLLLLRLGDIYSLYNQPDEALKYFEKAERICNEPALKCMISDNIYWANYLKKDYFTAHEYLKKAQGYYLQYNQTINCNINEMQERETLLYFLTDIPCSALTVYNPIGVHYADQLYKSTINNVVCPAINFILYILSFIPYVDTSLEAQRSLILSLMEKRNMPVIKHDELQSRGLKAQAIQSLNVWADIFFENHKYKEAIKYSHKAVIEWRSIVGKDMAFLKKSIYIIHEAIRRLTFDETVEYSLIIDALKEILNYKDLDIVTRLNSLTLLYKTYIKLGNLDNAIEACGSIIDIADSVTDISVTVPFEDCNMPTLHCDNWGLPNCNRLHTSNKTLFDYITYSKEYVRNKLSGIEFVSEGTIKFETFKEELSSNDFSLNKEKYIPSPLTYFDFADIGSQIEATKNPDNHLTESELKFFYRYGFLPPRKLPNFDEQLRQKLYNEVFEHINIGIDHSHFYHLSSPAFVELFAKNYHEIVGPASVIFNTTEDHIFIDTQIFVSYPGKKATILHDDVSLYYDYQHKSNGLNVINYHIELNEVTNANSPLTLFPGTHTDIIYPRYAFKVLQANNCSFDREIALKGIFLSNQGELFNTTYDTKVGTVFANALYGTYVQNCYYEYRYQPQAQKMHGYYADAHPGEYTLFNPTQLHTSFDENTSMKPRVSVDIRAIKIDDSFKVENAKFMKYFNIDFLSWMREILFNDNSLKIFAKSCINHEKFYKLFSQETDIGKYFFGKSLTNDSKVFPILTLNDIGYPFISFNQLKAFHCHLGTIASQICTHEPIGEVTSSHDEEL